MAASDTELTPAQIVALQGLAQFPLVAALLGRRWRASRSATRSLTAAGLPLGPRPAAADQAGAPAGAGRWRHHRLALRHHPQRRLCAPPGQLRRGAAGRTFPSAAGFHTVELFFTDDSGVWFFPTRDAGALVDPATEEVTLELMLERHRGRLRRLSDRRLHLPAQEPYMEGHNTWCVNVPGRCWSSRWPTSPSTPSPGSASCSRRLRRLRRRQRPPHPGIEEFAGLANLSEPCR